MKALIRNDQMILESDWTALGITATGEPLTHTAYYGGRYAMCEDAPSDSIASDYDISEVTETVSTGETDEDGNEMSESVTKLVATINAARYEARKAEESQEDNGDSVPSTASEDTSSGDSETVTYQGKEYTLEELKKLIGES